MKVKILTIISLISVILLGNTLVAKAETIDKQIQPRAYIETVLTQYDDVYFNSPFEFYRTENEAYKTITFTQYITKGSTVEKGATTLRDSFMGLSRWRYFIT